MDGLLIAKGTGEEILAVTDCHYATAYEKGFKRTVRFLISKGLLADVAEEMSQAAWVRGWERLGQLRSEACLGVWINQIALNLTHATRRLEPLEDIPGPVGHNVAAIDLYKMMKRCCPSHQELLHRHLEGQTTTEMAQEMGASEGAMRIRLMKARRALRAAA